MSEASTGAEEVRAVLLTRACVWLTPAGSEVRDHAPKQETPSSLPAPPQMPLPEIPQPWLVSGPAPCRFGEEAAPECVGAARSGREGAGSLPGGWCFFDNQCGYTAVEIRGLSGKISTVELGLDSLSGLAALECLF